MRTLLLCRALYSLCDCEEDDFGTWQRLKRCGRSLLGEVEFGEEEGEIEARRK